MTPEQAKDLLPIIKAYSEGKQIQVQSLYYSSEWYNVPDPDFDGEMTYRIKPEIIKIEHRRYLYNYSGYRILVCDSRAEAGDIITSPFFVRWIDSDWITEEVEINHD